MCVHNAHAHNYHVYITVPCLKLTVITSLDVQARICLLTIKHLPEIYNSIYIEYTCIKFKKLNICLNNYLNPEHTVQDHTTTSREL